MLEKITYHKTEKERAAYGAGDAEAYLLYDPDSGAVNGQILVRFMATGQGFQIRNDVSEGKAMGQWERTSSAKTDSKRRADENASNDRVQPDRGEDGGSGGRRAEVRHDQPGGDQGGATEGDRKPRKRKAKTTKQ